MADPIALFIDGLVSVILGYVVAVLVQAFVASFVALNTSWYFIVLYVVVVVIALVAGVINHVVGSFVFAAGILYGAYLVQDWVAFALVLILTALVVYARIK
jgi:hypothetical protein